MCWTPGRPWGGHRMPCDPYSIRGSAIDRYGDVRPGTSSSTAMCRLATTRHLEDDDLAERYRRPVPREEIAEGGRMGWMISTRRPVRRPRSTSPRSSSRANDRGLRFPAPARTGEPLIPVIVEEGSTPISAARLEDTMHRSSTRAAAGDAVDAARDHGRNARQRPSAKDDGVSPIDLDLDTCAARCRHLVRGTRAGRATSGPAEYD